MAATIKSIKKTHNLLYTFGSWRTLASSSTNITPLELNENHLNNIYSINRSDVKKCFPQDLPKKLTNRINTMGKISWLLREPSWTVIKSLKEEPHEKGKRFLFYGPDRCGKTVSLLQTIHYCLSAGWIVLYIPSVFQMTQSAFEVKQSLRDSSLFDVPGETSLWLQHFKTMNSIQLASVKIKEDYNWTKVDHAEKGDDLMKMIEKGILKHYISSDVFRAVFNEMTQLESHRVLIAVDDLNGLFSPTLFKLEALEKLKSNSNRVERRLQQRKIKPKDVIFVRHLLEHLDPEKFSGPVIGSLSRTLMKRLRINSTHYESLMIGEKGKELAKTFNPVFVPSYSYEELETCLENYAQEKWFTKGMEKGSLSELWNLSGGVPGELERLCLSL